MKRFFLTLGLCTAMVVSGNSLSAMSTTTSCENDNVCHQQPSSVEQRCDQFLSRIDMAVAMGEMETVETIMAEMRAWAHTLKDSDKAIVSQKLIDYYRSFDSEADVLSDARKKEIEEKVYSYKPAIISAIKRNDRATLDALRQEIVTWCNIELTENETIYALDILREMLQ